MIGYYLLVYVYSCYPARLKRFVVISNILIAFSSLMFLFIGFLFISGGDFLLNFPWPVYWFLFAAYFFIIPLKDIKDIKGDKEDRVFSIPVLIKEKNTRILIASLVFSFYLASVFVLKCPRLFLPALSFGTISFFLIDNKKISKYYLNHWVLGLVFLYGIFVVKIIF